MKDSAFKITYEEIKNKGIKNIKKYCIQNDINYRSFISYRIRNGLSHKRATPYEVYNRIVKEMEICKNVVSSQFAKKYKINKHALLGYLQRNFPSLAIKRKHTTCPLISKVNKAIYSKHQWQKNVENGRVKVWRKKYKTLHYEDIIKSKRKCLKRKIDELDNKYIIDLLNDRHERGKRKLKISFPQSVIELKREQLKLLREVNKINQKTASHY